jgi:two-component sensor histidine kinase
MDSTPKPESITNYQEVLRSEQIRGLRSLLPWTLLGFILGTLFCSWAFWINPDSYHFMILVLIFLLGIGLLLLSLTLSDEDNFVTSGGLLLVAVIMVVSVIPILFEDMVIVFAVMGLTITFLAGSLFAPRASVLVAGVLSILGVIIFMVLPIQGPRLFNNYQPLKLSTLIREIISGIVFFYSLVMGAVIINRNWMGLRSGIETIVERTERLEVIREDLKQSLEQKDVLLREVNHRVKNNMQVITSLINIQKRNLQDPKSQQIFTDLGQRIQSMNLLHEMLLSEGNPSRVNFQDFVKNLIRHFSSTYSLQEKPIIIVQEVEPVYMDLTTTLSCGMIINELLTNAVRYAFPDPQKGMIEVKFHQADQGYLLRVKDDGVSIPEGFRGSEQDSLGLELIETMVRRINGKMKVRCEVGSEFEIQIMN